MNMNARRHHQPDEPTRSDGDADGHNGFDEHDDRDAHDGGPEPTRSTMETAQHHEQATEELIEAVETPAATRAPSRGKPWRFGLRRRTERSGLPGLARSTTPAMSTTMHQRPARSITGHEDPEEGEEAPITMRTPPPSQLYHALPETVDLVNNIPVLQLEVIPQDRDMSCSICACSYEAKDLVVNLPCNHMYHFRCIAKWFFVEAINRNAKAGMTRGGRWRQQQRSSLTSSLPSIVPFWRRFRRGGRSTSVTTTTAAQSKKCQFPSSCPMCRCSVSLNDYESNDDPLWNARQQQRQRQQRDHHTTPPPEEITTRLKVWTGDDKISLQVRCDL